MIFKKTITSLTTLIVMIVSTNALATDIQYNLRVDGITCPFCVATSAKALRKIEGVHTVNSDIEKGIFSVCAEPTSDLNDEKLTKLFLDKGFNYRSKETLVSCEIK